MNRAQNNQQVRQWNMHQKPALKQAVQARLADSAMWLHASACVLSKLQRDFTTHAKAGGKEAATVLTYLEGIKSK